MTLDQIKKMDGQIVTLEKLKSIEESEHVTAVNDNGMSGLHYNKHWYSVCLTDSEEIQLYF